MFRMPSDTELISQILNVTAHFVSENGVNLLEAGTKQTDGSGADPDIP